MRSPYIILALTAAALALQPGLSAAVAPWDAAGLRPSLSTPSGPSKDPQSTRSSINSPKRSGFATPDASKPNNELPEPPRTASGDNPFPFVTSGDGPFPDSCNATFNLVYNAEIAPRIGAGQHYMDFTGSGLYLTSQVAAAAAQLSSGVFGNPHSQSPSSAATTALVDELRTDILAFFRADPDEYDLVWTRSATGALQALGEAFKWGSDSAMAYLVSNHNSVLGVREYAAEAGAERVRAVEAEDVEAWLADPGHPRWKGTVFGHPTEQFAKENDVEGHHRGSTDPSTFSLFAFPAQDNFEGILYPLDWVERVQAQSTASHKWHVLVDAAAFVPTHRLDLSAVKPDFVCISFYKMFGLPTGVGAWIMRKDAAPALRRVYWGGGSVFTATSALRWHVRHDGHERWEDGTLPFLDIMALRHGLNAMANLGGIDSVEAHVACLSRHLSRGLLALRHSDGSPMVRLFGNHDDAAFKERRQGSVANFQLLRPASAGGGAYSYKAAAAELAAAGFHVREGCMCNPGACYRAVGVTDEEVKVWAEAQGGDWGSWEWIPVKRNGTEIKLPLGTLRASLGWMSRVQDVDALTGFLLRRYRDREDDGVVPKMHRGPEKC